MSKVCIVVATLFTVRAFLRDQISALAGRYDVTIAANDTRGTQPDLPVRLVHAPIERPISPASDLRALVALQRLFRRERFDLVHSVTPKAGLLAMVAARAAGVPLRVHTFTGQVWVTRRGPARVLLKSLDRLTAACATQVLVDSRSQLAFLREAGVLETGRGEVLGDGSISGVDGGRFRPDPAARAETRGALSIPADAVVFLFLGRLSADKGVTELARAFASLAATAPAAWLLVVGPDEGGLQGQMVETAGAAAARIRFVGLTDVPERYMAAADVFVLPSHREGFGSVVIEAAAAGVPAIGSRIYGMTDAIDDGVTGVLVPPGDASSLARAMSRLAADPAARAAMATTARERALRDFSQSRLTGALLDFYERALRFRL